MIARVFLALFHSFFIFDPFGIWTHGDMLACLHIAFLFRVKQTEFMLKPSVNMKL